MILAAAMSMSGCLWSKKRKTARTPQPPHRSASRKSTASKKKPSAAAAPPVPSAVQPVALGEVLTPEQRNEFTRALDQSLSSARRILSSLRTRSLPPDQSDTVNLVRSFISQAERARHSDLALAAQLARRAELLAESLMADIQ